MAIGREPWGPQLLRAPPGTAAPVGAAVAAVHCRVATSPTETVRFPLGPYLVHLLGYPEDRLQALPPPATESVTGVACPVLAGPPIDGTGEGSPNGA